MPVRYIKVAPVDFQTTVLDTDDLSTIRGSSLTWAAMPRLLDAHLAALPEAEGYERLLASASELVFRVGIAGDSIVPLPEQEWPKKGKNAKWKALRKAAEGINAETSDDDLHALAAATPIKDWKPDQVLGALAWLRGAEAADEPDVIVADSLGSTIDAFLARAQDEGATRWPFDTMHFAHATIGLGAKVGDDL